MKALHNLALGTCAAIALAGSAAANPPTVIYDNGPANGGVDAFTINFGWQVADNFTAAAGSTATSMSFETWGADAISGDVPQTVEWEITNGNPLSGGSFTILGTGSAVTATISETLDGTNVHDLNLFSDTISLGSVALTCGSHCWIMLFNAVSADSQAVYWDANNGPSDAWQNNGVGDLSGSYYGNCSVFGGGSCSETFTIFGTAGAPEPAAWALMLSGFAGLGAALRSRRKLATA